MLRKRTRSLQQDQQMGHLMPDAMSESYFPAEILGPKHKDNSFFNIPGLFVGFNPKSSDSDSNQSPTSPLDFRIFSHIGNCLRSRKSINESHQKSWTSSKVGLSIVDSLADETKESVKILQSSASKNIIFGPQMRTRNPVLSSEAPNSLPKYVANFPSTWAEPSNLRKGSSDVVFEIGDALFNEESSESFRSCSLDSRRSGSDFGNFGFKANVGSRDVSSKNAMPSKSGYVEGSSKLGSFSGEKPSLIPLTNGSGAAAFSSIPASEIELSEDYTCVRTHGPNPKVTHIFSDCILDCHNDKLTNFANESNEETALSQAVHCSDVLTSSDPSEDFLKFCYSCNKALDGEDIYMYRGEKAFCSANCRSQEILVDEEMEKTSNNSSEEFDDPNKGSQVFERGFFLAT